MAAKRPCEETLDLTCVICFSLVVDAVQTGCCGAGFCRKCISQVQRGPMPTRKCPVCRKHAFSVYPDARAERLSVAKMRDCERCAFSGNRLQMNRHMINTHGESAEMLSDFEELEDEMVCAWGGQFRHSESVSLRRAYTPTSCPPALSPATTSSPSA